jgi:Zn-dependent peptidase ImmA (M78 family)
VGFVVVAVVFGRLPEGVHGYTDGTKIYLDENLNAIQMLCTLQHELIHVERGHTTRQFEASEMSVRYETAQRLLPLDRIGSCNKTGPLSEIAKGLGVTKRVLMDRAATLTDSDASLAGCWDCQKCPAIQMRAQRMVAAA